MALALVVVLALERHRVGDGLRYATWVALAWVCVGIHVLPALELLGCFALVAALDWWALRRDGQGGGLRRAALALAFLVGGAWLVARHPAFSAMVGISRNNGAFSPRHFEAIGAIGAYAVAIALASAYVLRRWYACRREPAGGADRSWRYLWRPAAECAARAARRS